MTVTDKYGFNVAPGDPVKVTGEVTEVYPDDENCKFQVRISHRCETGEMIDKLVFANKEMVEKI